RWCALDSRRRAATSQRQPRLHTTRAARVAGGHSDGTSSGTGGRRRWMFCLANNCRVSITRRKLLRHHQIATDAYCLSRGRGRPHPERLLAEGHAVHVATCGLEADARGDGGRLALKLNTGGGRWERRGG